MSTQRISFLGHSEISEPEMIAELEYSAKHGTPRPESQAIRAHQPAIMKAFAIALRASFSDGVLDHNIKEFLDVINTAIVGLGWWGKTLVEAVADGSEDIRFVGATTRSLSDEVVVTETGIEVITKFPTNELFGCGMNY
jgi:hypothetical protein